MNNMNVLHTLPSVLQLIGSVMPAQHARGVGVWGKRAVQSARRGQIRAWCVRRGSDACLFAPADLPDVITVAAADLANKFSGAPAGQADRLYPARATLPRARVTDQMADARGPVT